MKIYVSSVQGHREHMEDRYVLDDHFANKDWLFAGIYDGHSGKRAAELAALELHKHLLALMNKHSLIDSFRLAYEVVSNQITPNMGGTCALNFVIKDKKVVYAHAGDSRLIVIGEKGAQQLTADHRLELETEKQRIIKAGGSICNGYVFNGFRGLMVTRSIGDTYHKEVGVIVTPEVNTYTFSPKDKYLVAGTDGLFDYFTNEKIAEALRENHSDPADFLKELALSAGSRDNITVIVVALKRLELTLKVDKVLV